MLAGSMRDRGRDMGEQRPRIARLLSEEVAEKKESRERKKGQKGWQEGTECVWQVAASAPGLRNTRRARPAP